MINSTKYTFEQLCEMIRDFAPCMDDYPYVLDLENDIYYISEKAKDRFCMPGNYFKNAGKTLELFVHPDDMGCLSKDLDLMVSGAKQSHNITYRWLGKKKEPIWINCRGRVLCEDDGRPKYMIGCVNEVGRKPLADNVSGLLESSAIQDVLSEYCQSCQDGFILRVGIDDFKDINERFGIEYGDFVLHGVATCIEKSLQLGQKAYRVPSDEYLIVDVAHGTKEEAVRLYRRIRSAIDEFIAENCYEAVYTISGGILVYPAMQKPDYKEIMKLSQFALSEAKKRGKNQVYVFQSEDYAQFLRKREILRTTKQAVEDGFKGFELFFQPIVHADKGRLYAAEALLRFEMPSGERVSPAEFIPVLEESGLIIPVGKWVLNQAILMCKDMQKVIPEFRVSINLSYIQILKSSITDDIYEHIRESGLTPESLIVEITESGYLENTPSVCSVWEHLKGFGISIAVDDFGTGYSNLQSIGNLSPHVVKLDRGFTMKALQNDYENRIMRYVVDMVHSIQLKICVEGIETQEELSQIQSLNPDYIQGYYFGKPCQREVFEKEYVKIA